MKRLFLWFTIIYILSLPKLYSLDQEYYYVIPPFMQQDVYSNVYMALDYSGSMTSRAYPSYSDTSSYFGYFDKDAKYRCDGGTTSNYSCSGIWVKDNVNGTYSGNRLNYELMERIDILRYVLTGGGVSSVCKDIISCSNLTKNDCNNHSNLCYWSTKTKKCIQKKYCSSFTTESTCKADTTMCEWDPNVAVKTESGEKIKYSDVAGYNPEKGAVLGVLQKLSNEARNPRVGAVLFSSNNISVIKPSYDYTSLIKTINDTKAGGWTNTKDAIDTISNYYKTTEAYQFGSDTVPCAKNFAIVVSDGAWNTGYSNDHPDNKDPLPTIRDMWKTDLMPNMAGKQNVKTYTLAMFMDSTDDGTEALKHMAVFGGYNDIDKNGRPCNYSSDNFNSFNTNFPSTTCSEWDADNNGKPDGFFQGNNPDEFKQAIEDIFKQILTNVSSGTSVAVLTEKRKEGSLMTQAVFYPEYNGTSWIGKLFGYWFLNFKNSDNILVQNIRENTNINDEITGGYKLNICGGNNEIGGDYILQFNYDSIYNKLSIDRFKSDCKGNDNESVLPPYDKLEEIKSLFEVSDVANLKFGNDPSARKIYTSNGSNLINLDDAPNSSFGSDLGCIGTVSNLKNFIKGYDITNCEQRTDSNGTRRLIGDIVYSTPQIVDYDNVSILYVAANDGMLHAFRLGKTVKSNEPNVAVILQNDSDDNGTDKIGTEEWAFIPQNALPYLRYRVQKDFLHLYINDLTPYVFEYNGKKILIGGMRMGGGTADSQTNAIKPPDNMSIGYSSYYALDISDPVNPKFLWEFNDPKLGFTYSGPAIIRGPNNSLYIMFLSGMTNYNATTAFDENNAGVYILSIDKNALSISKKDFIKVGSFTTGIKNTPVYGNRLFTEGVDWNGDGVTDAVFFAFSYYKTNLGWISDIYAFLPGDYSAFSSSNIKQLMNSLHGAVSSSIVYMPCFGMDFIYIGTGRWFSKTDDSVGRNNKLYGIKISCLRNKNCNFSSAVNNADICTELSKAENVDKVVAWEVGLNTEEVYDGISYGKERVISDAGKMEWANTVLFTSMQPSTDVCSYGGRSRGWGLNCATGASIWDTSCSNYIVDTSKVSCGYLQTSTAAINQMCSSSFAKQDAGKYRSVSNSMGQGNSSGGDSSVNNINQGQTAWYTGTTPETPPIIPTPYSVKKGKIIFWIEK